MSSVRTVTATGVIAVKNSVIFGITGITVIDPAAAPPSGDFVVEVRDSIAADGSGELVAKMVLTQNGSQQFQLLFPAGIRCGKGIAVNMTLAGHLDVTVCVDLA